MKIQTACICGLEIVTKFKLFLSVIDFNITYCSGLARVSLPYSHLWEEIFRQRAYVEHRVVLRDVLIQFLMQSDVFPQSCKILKHCGDFENSCRTHLTAVIPVSMTLVYACFHDMSERREAVSCGKVIQGFCLKFYSLCIQFSACYSTCSEHLLFIAFLF